MKNKEYRGYAIIPHGKRFKIYIGQSVSLPNEEEARNEIDKFLERDQVLKKNEARFKRGKIVELFPLFYADRIAKNNRPASLRNTNTVWKWFRKDNGTLINVDEITIEMYQRWASEKMGHCVQSTRHQALIHIRAFVSWCQNQGYYVSSKFVEYSIPSGKDLAEGARPMTQEELDAVLAILRPGDVRFYLPILTMASFGIRPAELARIRVEDYDDRTKTLTVKARASKTRKARSMVVTDEMAALLTQAKQTYATDYIFINHHNKPIEPHQLNRKFQELCKKHQMADDLSLYSFRKYAANNICSKTDDIRVCYEILGHSDEVHEFYYTTHGTGKKSQIANLINAELTGVTPSRCITYTDDDGKEWTFPSVEAFNAWFSTFKPKRSKPVDVASIAQ